QNIGGNVLQITDFHYDKDYNRYGDISILCHNSLDGKPREDVGAFGNYVCDAPEALVRHAVKNAKYTLPNPDFILWTGDNVPHISGYNEEYVIDALNFTTSLLKSTFNKTQIIPTFGNHDYAPGNDFPDNGSSIYNRTYELWKDWIGPDAKETFLKGGYYKLNFKSATFLALNTNIYYNKNKATFTNSNDPADQFQFLEDSLEEARNESQIIHIVSHIPPGSYEKVPNFPWMPPQYNQKLVNIFLKYASNIKWMIFGHHHSDTFHILKKGSIPVQLLLICPAVTVGWQKTYIFMIFFMTFRVINYDDQTWDYTDIKTYNVDLNELNRNPSVNWTLEYSYRDAYNLSQINALTMNDLLQKMKVDNNLFYKYMTYYSAGWGPKIPDGDIRKGQLCAIEYTDYPSYYACLGNGTTNATLDLFLIILITLALIL
uniref:Uncharacterized protein n=1 Tax=Acrobeloides nanus TaxID=290746 RepID=A0A914C9U7_9BILA